MRPQRRSRHSLCNSNVVIGISILTWYSVFSKLNEKSVGDLDPLQTPNTFKILQKDLNSGSYFFKLQARYQNVYKKALETIT